MNDQRETLETALWSDRELMLRTYYQTAETNGFVRLLNGTVYGDAEHGVIGLVDQAHDNSLYRERVKAVLKVFYVVGGLIVSGMFALMGILLAAHL